MMNNNIFFATIHKNGCWMCGGELTSREHKYKQTEARWLYPQKDKGQPYKNNERAFYFSFDTGEADPIPGPKSDLFKYPSLICQACNNARSQAMDMAYDKFSVWCRNNPDALCIDLINVCGIDYIKEIQYFYAYILKVLGCEILSSGAPLPESFPNPLSFTFDSSHVFISICKAADISIIHPNLTKEMTRCLLGKGRLFTNISESDLAQLGIKSIIDFVWYRQIGNFQINIWYNIAPNPLLGIHFNGSSNIYNILDPGLDFYDIDYAMCSSIYKTTYIEWLQQKVGDGHGFPFYKLGKRIFSGTDDLDKNPEIAAHLYKIAAERGYVRAQYDLAWMHINGIGVEQNYDEAMKWCKEAIEVWHYPAAHYLIGFMYENGLGVTKDYDEALRRYQIAASSGFSPAQFSLGCMHLNAIGVEKNIMKALHLFELSASQGHPNAQNNLACMYASGKAGIQDYEKARYWWELSANQGHNSAQQNLQLLERIN